MTSRSRMASRAQALSLSPLVSLLRCLECAGEVTVSELVPGSGNPDLGPDGRLTCTRCGEEYPIVAGTVRMLALGRLDSEQILKLRTGETFTYEWRHFGDWRREWEKNFLDYVQPHTAESFRDQLVLDVGAGSGRHSLEASRLGAQVVAVDIGDSIDVARRNLPPEILTVQADAERLPFAPGTFDFVMALGVVHHFPVPERGLREIVRFARPGGIVHIYVYWVPLLRSHRAILRVVGVLRRITSRLPHRLLHLLCYPLAAVLYVSVVAPYGVLRRRPRMARIARNLPLKIYADYPFGVLVNDQFDRFSAPLEHRYTEPEVREMLTRCGLTSVTVLPRAGWLGDGRVPDQPGSDG